jgi:putative NADH-flavin reductase
MRILVLGASGQLGREVVRQASTRGHAVTAFVRRPPSPAFGPSTKVLIGDAMREDGVCAALAEQQAVVNTISGGTLRRNQIVSRTTGVAVAAAQAMGVTRYIAMSSYLVTIDWPIFRFVLIPLIYRNVVKEQRCTEQLMTASSLDWTVVRPSRLTNWPAVGYAASLERPRSFSVSRKDVAAFILDELESGGYIHQSVFIGSLKR